MQVKPFLLGFKMYKNTAKSEQFLNRVGSYSTHASRTGKSLVEVLEQEHLSFTQQRDALLAARLQVEKSLSKISEKLRRNAHLMTSEKIRLLTSKRNELRERHIEINQQQIDLKAVLDKFQWMGSKRSLGNFIADVVKERVTKPEWDNLVKAAKERYDLFDGAWPGDDRLDQVSELIKEAAK